MLHPQQQQAIEFLDDWLSTKEQLACLQGYAGTGKTWLVGYWLKEVLDAHPRWNVYVLAPTNKALDVLREKCSHLGDRVAFFTVDSFLGNRIKRDDDGEIQKSYGKGQQNPDLIVCDEASMIKKEYDTSLRKRGARTLYVGDPAQLPPIDEEISSSFTVARKFLMTEVVRYDGSIIKIATMLRKRIESKDIFLLNDVRALKEDNTVSFISIDKLHDWAENAHHKGLDSRILAFENATVNYHNKVMHEALFPQAPLFGVGEKVVVNETYELNEDEMLYNGEILTVVTCEVKETIADVVIYDVCCKRAGSDNNLVLQVALDEGHLAAKKKELTNQIWDMRKSGKDPKEIIKLRRPLNKLAPLRHSYACTVHKSQGSTYDIAFCDWGSIYRCADRARMFYVSMTRPSKFLVIASR